MWIQFISAAEVEITPARVKGAATGVRHITATGIGLRLLLLDLPFPLLLDVFCHGNHLPVFRYVLP
jgi:hypothetical protein